MDLKAAGIQALFGCTPEWLGRAPALLQRLSKASAEAKLPLVLQALERWPDQLLISQHAGWYNVGQQRGGQQAPFDWLPREFAPPHRGRRW